MGIHGAFIVSKMQGLSRPLTVGTQYEISEPDHLPSITNGASISLLWADIHAIYTLVLARKPHSYLKRQVHQEDNMGIATSPTIDPRAASFVAKQGKLLINNRWVDAASGKTFTTYNPANGEPLARVAEGDKEDINRAVAAARKAFDGGPWTKLTPSERGRMIWKFADLLEQNTEEFATLETLDNGKPLNVARAADVPLAVDCLRYFAGW